MVHVETCEGRQFLHKGSKQRLFCLLYLYKEGLYRTTSSNKMSDVKELVDSKIAGKKVMVFSKSSCPYCAKAKAAIKKYIGDILSAEEYEVMEIDTNPQCGEIQNYLGSITGGRTVPRVFIKGKFLGGGDETAAADRSGQLRSILQA